MVSYLLRRSADDVTNSRCKHTLGLHVPTALAAAALLVSGCEREPQPRAEPAREEPAQAPSEVAAPARAAVDETPDPLEVPRAVRHAADAAPGTALHRLVSQGTCYGTDGHDFVVCAPPPGSPPRPEDGLIAIGRHARLHVNPSAGATMTGDRASFSYRDVHEFIHRRPHRPTQDPVEHMSAPGFAYRASPPGRYFACGEDVWELQALPPEKSREVLESWELVVSPPVIGVDTRRVEDGTFVAFVTRYGGMLPDAAAVYAGRPGGLKRLNITRRDMVADGGSVMLTLADGGQLFLKHHMALFEEGAPAVTYPDGTTFEEGMVPADFEWSTFRASATSPELKLYVPTTDEANAVKAELRVPAPAGPAALGPCSAALESPSPEN